MLVFRITKRKEGHADTAPRNTSSWIDYRPPDHGRDGSLRPSVGATNYLGAACGSARCACTAGTVHRCVIQCPLPATSRTLVKRDHRLLGRWLRAHSTGDSTRSRPPAARRMGDHLGAGARAERSESCLVPVAREVHAHRTVAPGGCGVSDIGCDLLLRGVAERTRPRGQRALCGEGRTFAAVHRRACLHLGRPWTRPRVDR